MAFEHSEFENQRRIEHLICFFLERINPFLLAANGRWTSSNGFLRRESAVFIVTHDTAQETDIGGRNPVMVINIDSGQRRDENLKCQFSLHIRQDAWIESVQSFDDQHRVFLQFQFTTFEDSLSNSKVICRQFNLFPIQQIVHLLAEEG